MGFEGGSVLKKKKKGRKKSVCKAGNMSSIPGWGRLPGKGNGNLLQYSSWDLMDRGAWWASLWSCKSRTGLGD